MTSSTWWSSVVHRTFPLPKLVNPYWNVNRPENPKWALGIGCRLQVTYLWRTKFNNKYQNDLHLTSLGWHWYIFKCLYISLRHIYFWTFINDHPVRVCIATDFSITGLCTNRRIVARRCTTALKIRIFVKLIPQHRLDILTCGFHCWIGM